ncbi:SpoIIE family protein phosphatase [Streptomyces sp. NPDC088732]|uniref:SpoIIE family protein phosphatase n=1 Tax=Streptomyces sp. NPDC088732 TaxID=3365879 RepID=UPI003805C869
MGNRAASRPPPGDQKVAGFVLDRHGLVSAWSAAAEELFGYRPSEVVGRSVETLWPEAFAHHSGRAAGPAEGGLSGHRVVLARRDGPPADVVLHTSRMQDPGGRRGEGCVVVAVPVGPHTMVEGQALLEALFTQAPIGVAVYDRDLRVARVNSALERIHGFPEEEALGRSIGELLPGLDAEAIECRIRKVLETGQPIVHAVHQGRTPADPDRDHVWDVSSVVLTGPDGGVLGVADLIIDITDQYRTRERLALIGEAAVRIGTTLDVRRTCEELVDMLVPRFADVAVVDLLDRVMAGTEPDPEPACTGRVAVRLVARKAADPGVFEGLSELGELRSYTIDSPHVQSLVDGQPRLIPHLDLDGAWLRNSADRRVRAMHKYDIGSLILVPVRARGVTLGFVHLYRKRARPFEADDLVLANDVVARAAVCVDNARRYTNEHAAALTLHESMLPRSVADQSAVEVAHHYRPSRRHAGVGGDWFDVIPLSGARVALVVGAVPGEGFQAAACMGHLSSAIRTLAQLDLTPDELLGQIDEMVPRLLEREHASGSAPVVEALKGATCLYAVYDPISRRCVMASAGHHPPAVVSREGEVTFPDLPVNNPLGLGDPVFEPLDVELGEGSTLVLCSHALLHPDKAHALAARLGTVIAGRSRPLDDTCTVVADLVAPHLPTDNGLAVLLARTRTLDPEKVATWTVPPVPGAVGSMRALARRQLEQWGLERLAFDMELVVSELITNAIRHGHDPIRLRLVLDRTLICEVSDASSTFPHIRRAATTDEGGRGLFLVAQCSHRWGTRYLPVGKTIWAEQVLDPEAP